MMLPKQKWLKNLIFGKLEDSDLDFNKRMQVRILNGVSISAILLALINILWASVHYLTAVVILNVSFLILMVITIVLDRKQKFEPAKYLFFSSATIFILLNEMGMDIGAFYYFFPLSIMAAFLLRNKIAMFSYFVILSVLLIILSNYNFYDLNGAIDTVTEHELNMKNLIFAFVFGLLTIALFRFQYQLNKKEILQKNKLLSESQKAWEEKAEHEKLLKKEMNHRVKNNLQLISSLLNLHANQLKNQKAKDTLQDARMRISSISLIHRQLYNEQSTSTIDTNEYIYQLIPFITESTAFDPEDIDISVEAVKLTVPMEDAITIGLIINEILTNSLKHGVKDLAHKEIELIMSRISDKRIRVEVIDNGTGIQKMKEDSAGFGSELIKSLVLNHDGTMLIDDKINKITVEVDLRISDM